MKMKNFLFYFFVFLLISFSQDSFDLNGVEGAIQSERKINHKELRSFLNENYPSYLRKLKHAKESNKRLFRRMYRRALQRYMQIRRLKGQSAEDYQKALNLLKMDEEVQQLVSKYKNSETSETKNDIKAEIRKKVTEIFKLKEEIYKNEVSRIEKKLERAKKRILKREKNKDKIIKNRLMKLLQERDSDLEW